MPDIGAEVQRAFSQGQSPSTESVLTTLINEIALIPKDFVLILDDYHAIDTRPTDDALTLLLEHLPPKWSIKVMDFSRQAREVATVNPRNHK